MTELDLRDLTLFAAVARHRSFRRAALEARVSVSSLSQRLRDFEARLGVRLVNRTTRSVTLTEAGELLLARVAPALRDVTDALSTVQGLSESPAGRLRSEEHTSELQSLMRISYAVFFLQKKQIINRHSQDSENSTKIIITEVKNHSH